MLAKKLTIDSYDNFFSHDAENELLENTEPLLNHKSELYDDSTHVRVRVLSSSTFPIKFEDL